MQDELLALEQIEEVHPLNTEQMLRKTFLNYSRSMRKMKYTGNRDHMTSNYMKGIITLSTSIEWLMGEKEEMS